MLLTSSQTEGFSKIDTLSFNLMAVSCCGRLGSTETRTNKVETTTRLFFVVPKKPVFPLVFFLFSMVFLWSNQYPGGRWRVLVYDAGSLYGDGERLAPYQLCCCCVTCFVTLTNKASRLGLHTLKAERLFVCSTQSCLQGGGVTLRTRYLDGILTLHSVRYFMHFVKYCLIMF